LRTFTLKLFAGRALEGAELEMTSDTQMHLGKSATSISSFSVVGFHIAGHGLFAVR
jgi:hypothetical protein